MKVDFYKNNQSGEIFMAFDENNIGQATKLVPNCVEASQEKHLPVITIDGKKVNVTVGSVLHPSTAEHYISFICLVTKNKAVMKKLNPTDKPIANFVIEENDKVLMAYSYCNLHGLWKTEL